METSVAKPILKVFNRIMNSPFLLQSISLGLLLILVFGFRPENFSLQKQLFFQGEWGDSSGNFYHYSDEGFIYNTAENINSSTEQRKRNINYVIKTGDNISKIAHKFGLKVSTVLWMNELTSKSNIQPGQKIVIPPIDGVYYTVKKHDTLSEIAKAHSANLKKIYAYNTQLKNNSKVKVGDRIFIPEASKTFIPQKVIVQKPKYSGAAPSKKSIKASVGNGVISGNDLNFLRPTKGILTQGFHRKHYALDIGNRMNTPIYAVQSGRVITSQDGWNYGYGKYIIIDHGNGVVTLYSHMNKRKVAVGDTVSRGQLIGLMGNTGNVYGPTGVHLHFEVRINGKKKNPNDFF